MSAAKALALTLDVPYVGVNHLEAHLHAAWLEKPDVELPLAVLIVSGGHTMIVIVDADARYRLLNGLDEIGITLQSSDAIDDFERTRERSGPVTTSL